jgi:hypothetical protein
MRSSDAARHNSSSSWSQDSNSSLRKNFHRRRAAARVLTTAEARLVRTQEQLDRAREDAAPHLAEIDAVAGRLQSAERELSSARLRERMDALTLPAPGRSLDRGMGIER